MGVPGFGIWLASFMQDHTPVHTHFGNCGAHSFAMMKSDEKHINFCYGIKFVCLI